MKLLFSVVGVCSRGREVLVPLHHAIGPTPPLLPEHV